MYIAITTVDWGKPFKLLCVLLDASICSLAKVYRKNANTLIGAAILKSGYNDLYTFRVTTHNNRAKVLFIWFVLQLHGCSCLIRMYATLTCTSTLHRWSVSF